MSRSLAIADEFRRLAFRVHCQVNQAALPALPHLHQGAALSVAGDAVVDLDQLDYHYDVCLLDHYGLTQEHERLFRARCRTIIVLDDLHARSHDCDVIVNSAPGQTKEHYSSKLLSDTLILTGVAYAPLRREFRDTRLRQEQGLVDRSSGKVLVSFGAVDNHNATSLILKAIGTLPGVSKITVVLGSKARHLASVREIVCQLGMAELVVDADNMAQLIAEHDIAIGAPGVSALERACLGTPQILMQTADNQATNYNGLLAGDLTIGLGAIADFDGERTRDVVLSLLNSHEERRSLADNGQRAVDGLGAARIAALSVTNPKTKDGRRLTSRELRIDDGPLIFEWQSNPLTRQYFRNQQIPSLEQHQQFMSARLASLSAISEVLTLDGRPVALLRADPRGDRQTALEVSIVVDPEVQGQHIGRAALSYLNSLLSPATLVAEVDKRNIGSIRAFASAGYGKTDRLQLRIFTAN